jgi:hypothetical protein
VVRTIFLVYHKDLQEQWPTPQWLRPNSTG